MAKCRICNHEFFEKPFGVFKNMPKSAQFFPTADEIKDEKGINLEICQCSNCGVVQLTNEPVPYFKEVIRANGISKEMQEFREKQFKEFVDKFSLKNKKTIEIGCGFGEFLSIMDKFTDAYGLEYSDKGIENCLKQGLKATKGFVENENYSIPNAPFNAFYIMSFLEHLPDANKLLQGIYNNLTEDGVGLVEVPNFDMILQNNLYSEFIVDHLFYFTKETLENTLNLNGFEVIECKEIWHNYILSATIKKSKKFEAKKEKIKSVDNSAFQDYQEKLKKELNNYVDKFSTKNVAIWGAGHQSLTVIALAELQDKIKYVIDSAKFKQNKFTPATHIPILDSSALNLDPPESIIVIAGSYNNEVIKIIQSEFKQIKNIAVLMESGLDIIS